MATTKIHSIKHTLKKSLDYIVDETKTDNKILISTYGCSEFSADIEFEYTRLQKKSNSENLARHIIQSFSPGEVTPKEAHDIGYRLAKELLRGQYEFVLATHIDKEHVHNHIIVNEINFETGKTFSTELDRKSNPSWKRIRTISDNLCKEYNLFVIKDAERGHSKSHYEWEQSKNKTSWKDKLRDTIDDCVMEANNMEDFLKKMQEHNYEYKINDESLYFRAEGQKYFTCCRQKSLGWYYEPENIKNRIERCVYRKNSNIQNTNGFIEVKNPNENNVALQRWAMLKNMQEASEVINTLTEYDCKTPSDLKRKIQLEHGERHKMVTDIKSIEDEITQKSFLMKHISIYIENKPIYLEAKKKRFFKSKFIKLHEIEINLYKSSREILKNNYKEFLLPNPESIQKDIDALIEEKSRLMTDYNKIIDNISKLEKTLSKLETYLEIQKEIYNQKKIDNELE